MKKIKLVGVTLALFCTLSMAACGSTQTGQETQSESPAYSQGEMPGGNKDADAEKGIVAYICEKIYALINIQ